LQQTRIRYSQDYMWATLVKNAAVAAKLVELVYARFDPGPTIGSEERAGREAAIAAEIEARLSEVASLDEDRILRRFLNLVNASVRTNFFQHDANGMPRQVISLKFESRKIDNLPLPRPPYEITVYSPRVEGVHMRFGRVARGGLRWSDRPQDFRTEILGLAKAQQVKNAVIVPVGAKGGFVPRQLPSPSNRDAWLAEGLASYKIFVGALLDITDNLDGERIVAPENTVRHDGADPYLVVAADKGTATFSDVANAISLEHGHWLGDAFASGGSAGYDHKKMGITARGAWEAVKRHFREMDVDIDHVPFTVAGVGDMSGDVFGNGMLLSPATKLVAAFDHRDIFLDPDPETAKSLAERARLFALPRSSWQDYDRALISTGGGVFSRNAKYIPLSPEVRRVLDLSMDRASPQDVLTAILKAKVDLLWFGGIGTYVRAADEGDETVGDRANDAIRITGVELNCKVIGEGANLGMTQRGRIEAARRGVRLNTDAIDNSAGVNTSDVEVNIKIALSTPVRDGRLDEGSRADLLAAMTGEVAGLVLRNNYQQTLALSLAERRRAEDTGFAQRLMQQLEQEGRLDRIVEFLPDDAALALRARPGQGLTRPELAVLLAYAKLALHDRLLESPVPDDPYLSRELVRYFPHALRERFPDAIERHRLRREIVATTLSNSIVNRGGPTVFTRIADDTGADAAALAYAFAAVRDVFGLDDLDAEIDALDAKIGGDLQLDLYAAVQALLLSRIVWFVRNVDFAAGLDGVVSRFRVGVRDIAGQIYTISPETDRGAMQTRAADFEEKGVPRPLAMRIAALDETAAALDIVLVSERSRRPVEEVAATFFAADSAFGLSQLVHSAGKLAVVEYYDRLALDAALGQIEAARRRLSASIVSACSPSGLSGAAAVERWMQQAGSSVARVGKAVADVASGGATLSRLTVAASLLGELAPS
ncbi:MAG: NAD-glutamate dehydrogenase, partial [Methylobacteriaceae bacterium]|nr:NAD-glutamate dehydrogenase [Methylobacteriaceae bacterium]